MDETFDLSSIVSLNYQNMNLYKLPDLSLFTNLQELDLSYNYLTSITELNTSQFITLTRLDIGYNNIKENYNLNTLTNLKWLGIASNDKI
jgi:Leucine-rich repeat (LRR) protein